MSAKQHRRKTDLPVFLLTCDTCGRTVDGNTEQGNGFIIVPFVRCPECTGVVAVPEVQRKQVKQYNRKALRGISPFRLSPGEE